MIGYSFTKQADRQLRKFPLQVQKLIVNKLRYYLSTPHPLHYADSIEGEKGKVYRFRMGDYRVIFDWEGNHILVTKVALRAKAY